MIIAKINGRQMGNCYNTRAMNGQKLEYVDNKKVIIIIHISVMKIGQQKGNC